MAAKSQDPLLQDGILKVTPTTLFMSRGVEEIEESPDKKLDGCNKKIILILAYTIPLHYALCRYSVKPTPKTANRFCWNKNFKKIYKYIIILWKKSSLWKLWSEQEED